MQGRCFFCAGNVFLTLQPFTQVRKLRTIAPIFWGSPKDRPTSARFLGHWTTSMQHLTSLAATKLFVGFAPQPMGTVPPEIGTLCFSWTLLFTASTIKPKGYSSNVPRPWEGEVGNVGLPANSGLPRPYLIRSRPK